MNKYKIIVLSGGGYTLEFEVVADYFTTITSNSTSSGFYSFYMGEYSDKTLVCTYPIDKTIIKEVQNVE